MIFIFKSQQKETRKTNEQKGRQAKKRQWNWTKWKILFKLLFYYVTLCIVSVARLLVCSLARRRYQFNRMRMCYFGKSTSENAHTISLSFSPNKKIIVIKNRRGSLLLYNIQPHIGIQSNTLFTTQSVRLREAVVVSLFRLKRACRASWKMLLKHIVTSSIAPSFSGKKKFNNRRKI